jgi:PST family polysaccharide transporter
VSLRHWREMTAFGGWLTAASVLNYVEGRSDFVFMGASLDSKQVGQYSMGDQIASVGTSFLAYPFLRAIFPGLSAVSNDPARFRAAYHKAQQAIVGLLLPIGVGSALVAREAVLLIAGAQWLPAVAVVQHLAPIMSICLTGTAVQAMIMARGETRLLFNRAVLNLAVKLPVLALLLHTHGFMGVLYARIVTGLFQTFTMLQAGARLTGESLLTPLTKAWRSFAACGAMIAAVMALETALPPPSLAPIENLLPLVAKAAVGATTYAVAHFGLWLIARRPEGMETIVIELAAKALRRLTRSRGDRRSG